MTATEHRLLMALYRAENVLRQARVRARGTLEEEYVNAATSPALDIISERESANPIEQRSNPCLTPLTAAA